MKKWLRGTSKRSQGVITPKCPNKSDSRRVKKELAMFSQKTETSHLGVMEIASRVISAIKKI